VPADAPPTFASTQNTLNGPSPSACSGAGGRRGRPGWR
jgi:hypothetical protein